jgi:endonuclease/exonuclease/phosphatase family metal-dependent hydrolase
VLIRSWNLFHGNTSPPTRRSYLEEMVRLATEDRPAVLCLQELSVWAVSRLDRWSGMTCHSAVARRPRLPPPLDRAVTSIDSGLFRSLFTGQAQAFLLGTDLRLVSHSVYVLNKRSGLGTGTGERRICQIARVERPDGTTFLACNLHATNLVEPARAQVERVAEHVIELAQGDEPIVLVGDFNMTPDLRHLGFSAAGPRIDHILVRGANPSPLRIWPDERHRLHGMILSDHAPVELDLP